MTECKIGKAIEIEARDVDVEGAENVTIRWLVSKNDGAPNFAMRLFEIGAGGRTPFHTHSWEHEVYIVEGEGKIELEDGHRDFSKGYFIFVPEETEHSFVNTGDGALRFLCMVPND
jgi:quercetin dioxygenase-like cupin family protein